MPHRRHRQLPCSRPARDPPSSVPMHGAPRSGACPQQWQHCARRPQGAVLFCIPCACSSSRCRLAPSVGSVTGRAPAVTRQEMGWEPPLFVGQQLLSLEESEPDNSSGPPAADAAANEPEGVSRAPLLDVLARDTRARLMSVTVGMDSDSP
eukprot:scaffold2036_cov115-Isochrysis_galbana.AAC.7